MLIPLVMSLSELYTYTRRHCIGRDKEARKNMSIMQNLYNKHLRTVYGFFMVKTMHQQTAEDLTSEVFVTTLEQLQRDAGGHIQDPEKYLYGVMKLTWLTYLRAKYQKPVTYVEDIEDFEQFAENTIDTYVGQSLSERAAPYIARLPEKQRDVLHKRFIDGLSLAEICQALGKNMNYVKTTQKRGMAALKLLIASDGGK